MNVEYEEFSSVQEMLLFLSSAAPPMKNVMPINSYKGFICSFIPLNPTGSDLSLIHISEPTRLGMLSNADF